MAALVLELQSLAQTDKTSVIELVRRAKVVASKLKLTEFEQLLDQELNGYSNKVPAYRIVGAALVARSGSGAAIPVQFGQSNEVSRLFSEVQLAQPLATLLALASKSRGTLSVELNPEEFTFLQALVKAQGTGNLRFCRQFDASVIHGIAEAVRNEILNWSLRLEKEGVLGEDMTFTEREKKVAKKSIVINNFGVLSMGDDNSVAQASKSPRAAPVAVSAARKPKRE